MQVEDGSFDSVKGNQLYFWRSLMTLSYWETYKLRLRKLEVEFDKHPACRTKCQDSNSEKDNITSRVSRPRLVNRSFVGQYSDIELATQVKYDAVGGRNEK